jgi:hypothetical protein
MRRIGSRTVPDREPGARRQSGRAQPAAMTSGPKEWALASCQRYANGRPITSRRYDHLRSRLGRHLRWVRTQQISTHWIRHATLTWLAELRRCHRPRLQRPHRYRQRDRRHGDLRARQPGRRGRRAGRADRRAPPARHDRGALTSTAAVTVDPSPAADPGLRGPVEVASGLACAVLRWCGRRAGAWVPASPPARLTPLGLSSETNLVAARDGNRDDQPGAAGGCGMLVSPGGR